jgi:hypothetical protein
LLKSTISSGSGVTATISTGSVLSVVVVVAATVVVVCGPAEEVVDPAGGVVVVAPLPPHAARTIVKVTNLARIGFNSLTLGGTYSLEGPGGSSGAATAKVIGTPGPHLLASEGTTHAV